MKVLGIELDTSDPSRRIIADIIVFAKQPLVVSLIPTGIILFAYFTSIIFFVLSVIGSIIAWYLYRMSLTAKMNKMVSEVVSRASAVAYEGQGKQHYERDILADRQFIRATAGLMISSWIILIAGLVCSILLSIIFHTLAVFIGAVNILFWFVLSIYVLRYGDEAANKDFAISVNGAFGKLLATDTIQTQRG